MNSYQRIFGAGPRGLAISLLLLATAWKLGAYTRLPAIHGKGAGGLIVFFAATVMTVAIISWSTKTLHPLERGKELVTTGAFRYFRHPLYAAFLTFFNFGLAFLFNNWIYLIWAILQHPVWHLNVISEEKLMERAFPGTYREYCARTGRFIPRPGSLRGRE